MIPSLSFLGSFLGEKGVVPINVGSHVVVIELAYCQQ